MLYLKKISRVAKHLNLNQDYDHSALIIACEAFVKQSKSDKYHQKKNPVYTNHEEVIKIKQIIDMTNRYLIPAYLFNIIKFQTIITNNKVYKQVYYCINNIINDENNLFYFFTILMYFLVLFFVIHFFLRFNKNNNTRVRDVE